MNTEKKFQKALSDAMTKNLFQTTFTAVYIEKIAKDVIGCSKCARFLKHGLPFTLNGSIFDKPFRVLGGHPQIPRDVPDKTLIKILVSKQGLDPIHLGDVYSYVDLKFLEAKLFGGKKLTKGVVLSYQKDLGKFFKKATSVLKTLLPTLSRDVKSEVSRAIGAVSYLLSLKSPLEFVECLVNNPEEALLVKRLFRFMRRPTLLTRTDISVILIDAFDSDLVGVSDAERVLRHGYGSVHLRWDALCDLDLYVCFTLKNGEEIIISYQNKEAEHVFLDLDNTWGGPGSTEIISFSEDFQYLVDDGKVKILVLNYSGHHERVPFDVCVTQGASITTFQGIWDPEEHSTGSVPENACFSIEISLKKALPKRAIQKLPEGVRLAGSEDFSGHPTILQKGVLKAGQGQCLNTFLVTPEGHFRHSMSFLPVGKALQIRANHSYEKVIEINGKTFVKVEPQPFTDIPLVITLSKNVFAIGPEGLRAYTEQKGDQYSPIAEWSVDGPLSEWNVPYDIVKLIMAFLYETPMIQLFCEVKREPAPLSEGWWSLTPSSDDSEYVEA